MNKKIIYIFIELNFLESDLVQIEKNEEILKYEPLINEFIKIYNHWTIKDKLKFIKKQCKKILKTKTEFNSLSSVIGEKNAKNIKILKPEIIDNEIVLQIGINENMFDLNGSKSVQDFATNIIYTSLADFEWESSKSSFWIVLTDYWKSKSEINAEVGLIGIKSAQIYISI